MQKKIIALAVAGLASTAAFAQSNVTIYGVADGSFDVVKASGGTVSGSNIGTFTRASSNSSLIGFKGAEALGNGLTAVFQYESSVDFAGGAAFGGANRDSYVGVAGGFGTVALGNLTGPTRALGAALDVNSGATGIGANSGIIGKLANVGTAAGLGANGANSDFNLAATCARSGTCTSAFDSRWKNALAYISPNFGGASITAAYVSNENKSNDAANGTAKQVNTKGYDLGLNYKTGPIMAGLTYNWGTVGNTLGTKVGLVRLGGSYDFGMGTVRAMYDWAKAEDVASGGDALKQQDYGVGLTFKVGAAGNVIGQYYAAKSATGSLGSSNTGAKLFALGYEHSLSKRTMVKAVYSRLASDNKVAYDYGINAVGASDLGGTLQGIQVGVRHTF